MSTCFIYRGESQVIQIPDIYVHWHLWLWTNDLEPGIWDCLSHLTAQGGSPVALLLISPGHGNSLWSDTHSAGFTQAGSDHLRYESLIVPKTCSGTIWKWCTILMQSQGSFQSLRSHVKCVTHLPLGFQWFLGLVINLFAVERPRKMGFTRSPQQSPRPTSIQRNVSSVQESAGYFQRSFFNPTFVTLG